MMQVVSLDNVTVVKNNEVILDRISFEVEMGSFVYVIGNNASGKSTLIKTIGGLLKYSGYININGYYLDDVGVNSIRENVSTVLSDIDEEILGNTVWDNLVMPLIFLNKSESYIKKRVADICSLLKINKRILNKKMVLVDDSLRKKILIASAIISKPSILLLDDVLNKMSFDDKQLVLTALNKIRNEENMTIIMATNNVEDIFSGDYVIVLNQGKMVMNDKIKGVFSNINKLKECGFNLPFVVELSLFLLDKGLIDNIYVDERKLVDALWK